MSTAATVRRIAHVVMASDSPIAAAPVSGVRRARYASLYEADDCAVADDYAAWIVGEEAELYYLRAPRVPSF